MSGKRVTIWVWGTVISSVAAAGVTFWMISINTVPESTLTWRIVVVILLMLLGCLMPFGTWLLSKRTQRAIELVIIISLWLWWMFFFNEVAYFGVPAFFSTGWMIARWKNY